MRLSWVLLMLVIFCTDSLATSDSLLNELKKYIQESDRYVQLKVNRINNLKRALNQPDLSSGEEFQIVNNLYLEYRAFIYDSAVFYAQQLTKLAKQSNDRSKLEYARVKTAFALNSAGLFKETFDTLHLINSKYLSDTSKADYYNLKSRANFDLGEFDANDFLYKVYRNTGNLYLDSGMMLSSPDSYAHLDMSNYKYLMNNEIEKGLVDVNRVLAFKLTDHQRAISNHHLGVLYLKAGDTLKAIDAFTISAIHDIRGAIKETTSTTELANLFFLKGNIEDAYLIIHKAMDDAVYYGARQRKARIASLLPLIAAERINRSELQRRAWINYSIILTILIGFTLIFVFVTRRQYKKIQEADLKIIEANERLTEINKHLREADKIKEEYIGYYFNITSDYINKIETFRNAINQKVLARKFDDLRHVTESFDIKKEKEDLYKGFDQVFIKLFPDFVASFNAMFPMDSRFELKEGQILNTEMRIFALIRLGIYDTESIARILGYSVNTIYTYKTKVKSKSLIPNDDFENQIKSIKSFQD